MSSVLATIFAFLAPILKDVLTKVITDYLNKPDHRVIERTANVIKPEAVDSVYNPIDHMDKFDRLLTQD
jgi:hypothetical protein